MSELVDDLRQQIAKRQVVAIIGTGVSVGATGSAPTASWSGLLKDGITRCESVAIPKPQAGWGERSRASLDVGDLHELLGVADQVEKRLGAPKGGEFRKWLRASVGELPVHDRAVLEALSELGVCLATTNYDDLLEKVTGYEPVTWREGHRMQRVLRGDEKGILHLHGHWEQPESVVLGYSSYADVVGDDHAKTVRQALALMSSFLFVGCGQGLADPNFRVLLGWMGQVFAGSEYRHFRLCLESEQATTQDEHPQDQRIHALAYGKNHADLAPFLRSLAASKPIAGQPSREFGWGRSRSRLGATTRYWLGWRKRSEATPGQPSKRRP